MGKRPGTLISLHGMPRSRTRTLGAIMLPDGDGIILRGPVSSGPSVPLSPAACDYAAPPPGCSWATNRFSNNPCNAQLVCTGGDGSALSLIAPAPPLIPPAPAVLVESGLPAMATAPAPTPAATVTNAPLSPAPAPQNTVGVNVMPSSPQIAAASPAGSAATPQVVYDPVTGQMSIQQPSTFSSFLTWLESASIEESVLSETPGTGSLPNWGLLGIAAALFYAMSDSGAPKRKR